MSSPLRLVPLLLVGLLTAPTDAAETLSMKFREGDKYGYRISQDISTTGEAQGKKFDSVVEQKLLINTLVKSVNADGSARAEQTIDRVQMKMELPDEQAEGGKKTVEIDSASKEKAADPASQGIAANVSRMVGQAISMTISPRGEMTDITLPENLRQPQGAAPAEGGNKIEDMFKQSGLRLPAEEISAGHQWKQEMEVGLPYGKMQITTNYTYEGKNDDGLHKIAADMEIELKPLENAPFKVTATAKEAKGSFLFDNEAGRLTQSQIRQVLDVDLAGTIKQTITTVVNMELTDGSTDEIETKDDDN